MIHNLVSTVIPVKNRPRLLAKAVESVLLQSHRPIEIIIADDGSTDDTRDLGRALESGHPGEVRYLWNESAGPGFAREAGRRLARGEFVQYLDSDDLLMPTKFEIQVASLRANEAAGAAYGITRLIDDDGRVLAEPFKWTGIEIPTLFPRLLVDRWWCTHTPLYRTAVLDRVGPWTNLRFSQDWEYDARVGALGTRLVWCREVVSCHRRHQGARQTGEGNWLDPMDRVEFFRLLLDHARKAGVRNREPEMKHFARWVFSHSRQTGLAGHEIASRELFALAMNAIESPTVDMRAYRGLVAMLGWARGARLAAAVRAAMGRTRGPDTQRLSWMENSLD